MGGWVGPAKDIADNGDMGYLIVSIAR